MRVALVCAFAFAFVALVSWVWLAPAPESIQNNIHQPPSGSSSAEDADAGAGTASAKVTESESTAKQSRQLTPGLPSNHEPGQRVRVLRPDGQPAVGVQVYFKELSESDNSDLIEIWSQPGAWLRPWRFVRERVCASTDESGIATLSSFSCGVAAVYQPPLTGGVFVSAIEQGTRGAIVDLQLQAVESVEVRVIDEDEQAVEGVEVRLSLVGSAQLEQASGEARDVTNNEGIWRKTDVYGWSDATGRVTLPLEFHPRTLKRLGNPDSLAASAWAQMTAGEAHETQFALPRKDPVTLRVASHGSLRIHLEGYPDGVMPVLYAMNEWEEFIAETNDTEGGSAFLFDRIPIVKPLRVGIALTQDSSNASSMLRNLDVPLREISGPSGPGVIEDRFVRFKAPDGLRGRFVVPEHRKSDVDLTAAWSVHAKAILKSMPGASHQMRMTIFPDGEFFVRLEDPASGQPRPTSFADYERICFEWQRATSKPTGRRTLYAERSLLNLDGVDQYDLGDVELLEEPALLEVKVVDAEGIAVPQAMLRVGARMQAAPASHVHFGRGVLPSHTDTDGKVWVQDHDWYTQFNLPYADHEESKLGAIQSLVVDVSHSDYVAQRTEFDLNQRQLIVTMAASSSFECSLVPMPGLAYVWITLLPPGASLDDANELAVVQHGVIPDGSFSSFTKQGVPAGTWDVVFTVMTYGQGELLRIPNVVLRAGETCRDPRLQEVDLNALITRYEVEFRNSDGDLMQPPDLTGSLYYNNEPFGISPKWQDGQVVLAAAAGEAPVAWFYDSRWLGIDMRGLTPGQTEFTVHPRRVLPVVIVAPEVDLSAFRWQLTWSAVGLLSFPTVSTPSAPVDLTVNLLRAGEHQVAWRVLDLSGDEVATVNSRQQVDLATLISGNEIQVAPPPSLLAKLAELQD